MLEQFILYLKNEKKYSDLTIKSYEKDIIELKEYLKKDYQNIKESDITKLMSYLYSSDLKRNSIARKLSSYKSFYKYLYKNNIIKINPFTDIKSPKKEKRLPKFLTKNELRELFQVNFKNDPYGKRDRAIVELLYATGLRVSELINIKTTDIDLKKRIIKVMGKGSKERFVIYANETKTVLEDYIDNGRRMLAKNNNEYLFLNKNGNKISAVWVRKVINKVVEQTSIKIHVSPHTLRHSFATSMLNEGADLISVKELLGHSLLETTSIYTHITDDELRKTFYNAHPRGKI